MTTALTAAKAIEKAAEEQTETRVVGYYKAGAKAKLDEVIASVKGSSTLK